MKRYFLKSALLILSLATLISCDEDTVTYGGKNFVSFERVASNRITFFEHLGVSEIPVDIAFPVNHDVTVKFTVKSENGIAVPGVDYNVVSNEVVIPAGATSGNIKIEVINNEIMNDSKALEITLTEISDSDITLGMKDAGSKFKRFLIVNDDCTTNFFDFVGDFYVTAGGDDIGIATVDVNDNGDCNIIRISGPITDFQGLVTDNYLQFTMAPGAGANPNTGSLTGVQQLYCSECFSNNGKQQTMLFSGGGSFSYNVAQDVRKITITGTMTPASGDFSGQPSNVTLEKIKE